jgi:hypothetical protein
MSARSAGMDDERLRALTGEMVAVVRRHAPEWTGSNVQDPGTALLELLAWVVNALGDAQDRVADEAYLDTARRLGRVRSALSDAPLTLAVDGAPWTEGSAPAGARGSDRVFVVGRDADGTSTVRFGDGRSGVRPPSGSEVTASYRHGAGGARLIAAVRWPPEPGAMAIRLTPDSVSFAPPAPPPSGFLDCLARCLRRGG